jgi:hypothetical protein
MSSAAPPESASTSVPFSEALAAERLADAPQIEQEWNNMSYKDRVTWWASTKWYGYMSTEAYRRGEASSDSNMSSRYGEPGFFIGTRVPYYDAQAAVMEVVAASGVDTAATVTATAITEPLVEPAVAVAAVAVAAVAVAEPAVAVAEPAANTLSTTAIGSTETKSAGHKKKKKHHGNGAGGGKTIEIRVGGQQKN